MRTAPGSPSPEQRNEILPTIASVFSRRFYDPQLHGVDLPAVLATRHEEILNTRDFGPLVSNILREEIRAYPLDFFEKTARRYPLGRIIGATFHRTDIEGCSWMLQDIQIGQMAHKAGIKPGALLLDGTDEITTEGNDLLVEPSIRGVQLKNSGSCKIESLSFDDPNAANGKNEKPPSAPLERREIQRGIGYIRISNFPGILGIDIARATDRAFRDLRHCERIIVDIRGNTGSAGAGNVRLMSYLTSGKSPVGYSLTRPRAERGYQREELARFERIPSLKVFAPLAMWRFRNVDKSIVVVTEGLGRKKFHGRTVLLVNEHTVSGAEIIAGFASDHRLAVLVGSRTAGHLLAFGTFPVGHDYYLTLPIANYLTWEGKSFEGVGIAPDVEVPFSAEHACRGIDNQLEKAIEVVRGL